MFDRHLKILTSEDDHYLQKRWEESARFFFEAAVKGTDISAALPALQAVYIEATQTGVLRAAAAAIAAHDLLANDVSHLRELLQKARFKDWVFEGIKDAAAKGIDLSPAIDFLIKYLVVDQYQTIPLLLEHAGTRGFLEAAGAIARANPPYLHEFIKQAQAMRIPIEAALPLLAAQLATPELAHAICTTFMRTVEAGADLSDVVDALEKHLDSKEEDLVFAAAYSLGYHHAATRDWRAFDALLSGKHPTVRRAARRVLCARLVGSDDDIAEIVDRVAAGLLSADADTRNISLSALEKAKYKGRRVAPSKEIASNLAASVTDPIAEYLHFAVPADELVRLLPMTESAAAARLRVAPAHVNQERSDMRRRLTRHFVDIVRYASLVALVVAPGLVWAQSRSLAYSAVSITAHLDSTGTLRIQERQSLRLSGDWNGAERTFNLRPRQSLELLRLSRIPAGTASINLSRDSDIDDPDEYDVIDRGSRIRWRARRPSDPVFSDDTLTYELDLVFRHILVRDPDGTLRLDHNFAMIEREGPIDRFELTLTLDPAWEPPYDFTGRFSPGAIPPGTGFLVNIPLRYRGAGAPPIATPGTSDTTRLALAALLGAALLVFLARLIARERALGRLASVPDRSEISAEWLQHHLFSMLPETAGAMWDDHTSAAEVAAVLARMVQEGKLSNRVETQKALFFSKEELHLALEVDRSALAPHELALVEALFRGNDRRTSTAEVHERYKATGFDPAAAIRKPLDAMIGSVAPGGAKPEWKPTGLLLLGGLVSVGIGVAIDRFDASSAFATLGLSVLAFLVSTAFAAGVQKALDRIRFAIFLLLVVVIAVYGSFAWFFLLRPIDALGPVTLVGLLLWFIGLARSTFNIAQSRQSAERIAIRKRLFAARRLFQDELRNERPALKDEWFPYVIAFGLGAHADRWFKAFGGTHDTGSAILAGRGASGGSASGTSGWTGFGGGGGFSGGGSSASFAAAVGAMAASVPSPSSGSSGGGGSSSSGGSSGGGGGGGW